MSIAGLVAYGMEEDVQKDLLSRCGNCCMEFENEEDKITEINIRTTDHYHNSLGNTVDYEKISLTAVQALSRIYGYPLNCSQNGPWSENHNCSLCKKCVNALTDFYRSFQELQKLTNEVSYISRGLNQIYKCIEKTFSSREESEIRDEKRQNEAVTSLRQKRVKKKSASISPRKIKDGQDKGITFNSDSKEYESSVPAKNVDSAACILEVKLEVGQGSSSEILQGNSPRKEIEKKQEEMTDEPVRGTTEVICPSGQIIRQSTRTRKARKLIDLGESIQRKPALIGSGGKRNQRFLNKERFETQNEKDDGYNNQTNLKAFQDGRFVCPEPKCLKAFKGIKMLNKHVAQHVKKATLLKSESKDFREGLPMKCDYPNASGSKLSASEDSKEGIETTLPTTLEKNATSHEKQYKCEHCDKRFLLKKMFEKHLSSHENQRAQCRCTICDKKFSTAFSLARHLSSIHDASEKKEDDEWQIDKKREEFPPEVDREGPGKQDGEKLETCFKCNQCNKEFKKKSQLKMHILFHNDKEPRFGCSKCPKTFFQPTGLRRHMLIHTTENPLVCRECDKVFERHVDMVHNQKKPKRKKVDPKNDPDHTCKECHKTFSRKEYLSRHMRIHTGEKPHMCSICGKQFRDPRNLAQHLVTHKTDRPFCCSVCGLTFKRAHHLNDHEGTHRQNVARPFACTFPHCEKAFKLRKHLVSQELVHTGSKDHPCHVCGRAFSRKDNLRQHINKIHGKEFADDMKVVLDQQREKYRQAQEQKRDINAREPDETEDCLELENILGEVPTSTSTVNSELDLLASDDSQVAEVICIIPSISVTLT